MSLHNRKLAPLIIDLIMMSSIFLFLLCFFEPRYLLSNTTTTGGDTASHYFTARYLKDYLLPGGKISGWCQGNLAGFPILQYYFPLPFLMMAVLAWFIPLQIAFKLVTVLGIFLLPPCTYLFFRFLRQPFPVPIVGSVFCIPFLFMEGNSMWGANISSTLAGEFCFSLGFALAILWLGFLYYTLTEQRRIWGCSILLALIGFCHGYTLLFAGFASLYFLFLKNSFSQNLKKLFQIFTVSILLMAFWLLPLILFLPYTTLFSLIWIFFDWKQICRELFPAILYPFMGLMLVGTIGIAFRVTRRRFFASAKSYSYLWFMIICGLGLYGIGYRVGLVDIRFLPFVQFFFVIGGALAFSLTPVPQKANILIGFIVLLLTFLWVDDQETFIGKWIKSNYSGFESKQLWQSYHSSNQYLKGSAQDPRVVYEHSMIHAGAGTVRAFESIPLFSGRSTLEGLYIQASLCVPFIFYIQSEISQTSSMPIPNYNYSRFNMKRAVEHLKLFNVRDFVIAEPATKAIVKGVPEFRFRFRSGPYEIYELLNNANRYAEPLGFKPVLVPTKDWRRISYRWFRLGNLSVPIVFKDEFDEKDSLRFNIVDALDIRQLPEEPVDTLVPLRESVREEEIVIEGAAKGRPLLIKISYHPNWKVEGADEIYLVSPAFMLIYPSSSTVRLYYGRTLPDFVGALLTGLGLFIVLFSRLFSFAIIVRPVSRWYDRYGTKLSIISIGMLFLAGLYYLIFLSPEFPVLRYNKGLDYFSKQDYGTAKKYFKQILKRHAQTLIVDQAGYHYAMCFYREKDWDNTIESLRWLLKNYPETGRAAEARYHIGLCYLNLGKKGEARKQFKLAIKEFPTEIWANFARDRLQEMEPL
jgi:tetratricopeptide (TPR) repeat protein